MVHPERSSVFVAVKCSCGRGLRAKSELVGTEVRCWDCRKLVLVPMPSEGPRVARELSIEALSVMRGPSLGSLLIAGSVVTAALAVPEYGVLVAMVILVAAASEYGEIIRRFSEGRSEDLEIPWARSIWPGFRLNLPLCVLMAMGVVLPLWWRNAGPHQSPHWDAVGLTAALATYLLAPILMLVLHARNEQGARLDARFCLFSLLRHPVAAFLAIAIVPLTYLVLEVGITLIFYWSGDLPFYALDFMPPPLNPEKPAYYAGGAYYHLLDYRLFPESVFYKGYGDGVRHGYSFVAAIPASLSMATRGGMERDTIGIIVQFYTVTRVMYTMAIVTSMLAAFAIQARWLASITSMTRKRKVG